MAAVTAYPLAWPHGWPRRGSRNTKPSGFKVPRDKAIARLENEITRLGGKDPVLSTNLKRNMSGGIHGAQGEPADPGVAVYFTLKGTPMVFACDRFPTVRENVHAIELTIEALRGIQRWGASDMMERAFTGFEALPPPGGGHWSTVLGVGRSPTVDEVNAAYRDKARAAHPDAGGSTAAMAMLNAARDAALAEIAGGGR